MCQQGTYLFLQEHLQGRYPYPKALRRMYKDYILQKANIDNRGAVLSSNTEKVQKYSGSGWVFLFNTKISLDIDVKELLNSTK